MSSNDRLLSHAARRIVVVSVVGTTLGMLVSSAAWVMVVVRSGEGAAAAGVVGVVVTVLLYLLVVVAWCVRGWLARSALSASGSRWRVIPLVGVQARTCLSTVALVPAETPLMTLDPLRDEGTVFPDEARWQHVLWDPALDRISPGEIITAHLGTGLAQRAVVELGDGTRIWPTGPLRSRGYRSVIYTLRPGAFHHHYTELRARALAGDPNAIRKLEPIIREEFDLPPGASVDPADEAYAIESLPVTLRPPIGIVLFALGLGALTGAGIGGLPYGAIVGSSGLFAMVYFLWGWYGGDPERPQTES